MDEEEITIEINIDARAMIILLLVIIALETSYIGYLHFFPTSEAGKSSAVFEEPKTIDEAKETGEPSFDSDEPKTFDDLKADLIAVGCKYIIEDWNYWKGERLKVNYTEALKLAKKAAFVGVNEKIEAFLIFLDGDFYIWFARVRESDYWYHEYIETYRDYDIYYFKNIKVYGIDTGDPDPMDWVFTGSVETAKGKIDNWLEEPEEIEIYRMWKIYRQAAGTRFYWAEQVNTGEKTTLWVDLDDLKEYIDARDIR